MKKCFATILLFAALSIILSGCGSSGGSNQNDIVDGNVSGGVSVTPVRTTTLGAAGTVQAASAGSNISIRVSVQPYDGGSSPDVAVPKISTWKLKTSSFVTVWVDTLPVTDGINLPGAHTWQTSYTFDHLETGLYTVLASVISTSGKQIVKPIGTYYFGP